MTERRPHMRGGQQRVTVTRAQGDKWVLHIDGTRRPGTDTAGAMAMLQELLADPDQVVSVMVETKAKNGDG